MGVNKKHISMREGGVYLDGVKIMESVTCQIKATPEVWVGRSLGRRNKDRRWIGMDYVVSVTEYKSTPWLKETVQKYQKSGDTPEFTIQGVQNDENSDYQKTYGIETVTATGCVLTSDIILIDLDTEGEMVKSELEFGANDLK